MTTSVTEPLTPAQWTVLMLASEGLTNAEIARGRDCSIETVKTLKATMLRKLRARNTTHAVSIAFRTGLIS